MKKTQRQLNVSLTIPPNIGPITPDNVNPAVATPIHFARSDGAHSAAMMIHTLPITPANAAP